MAEELNPFATNTETTVDYFGFKSTGLGQKQAERAAAAVEFASEGKITKEQAVPAYVSGNSKTIEDSMASIESFKVNEARQAVIRDFARIKAEQGGELTPQELQVLQNLSKTDLQSPQNALERAFANKALATQLSTEAGQMAVQESPKAMDEMDIYEDINTTNAFLQKKMLEVDSDIEKQGWGSWLADTGSFLIPAYEWVKMRNVALPTNAILPGNNLQEQIQYVWSLPVSERNQKIEEVVEDLKGSNLQLARIFVGAVMNTSSQDTFTNNLFGVLDAGDIGLTGLAVAGGVKLNRLRKALQSSTAAIANPRATVQSVVNATGNATAAAVASVSSVAKRLRGDYLKDIKEFRNHVDTFTPSLVNPTKEFGLSGFTPNLRSGTLNDVSEILETNVGAAQRLLTEMPNINRIEPDSASWRTFVTRNIQEVQNILGGVRTHTIKDVSVLPASESTQRVATIAVDLARPSGDTFITPQAANFWAKNVWKLPDNALEIVQVGNEYVARYKTPMREDISDIYDDLLIDTQTKTPNRWSNQVVNFFRSSMAPLSPAVRSSRLQLSNTFAPIADLMDVLQKPINKLSNKEGKRVQALLNAARDRGIKSKTEGFAKDIAEFEVEYLSKFKQPPSAKEVAAYFTAKQLMDVDYLVRNHSLYAEKSALGVRQHTLGRYWSKDAPTFEGRIVKNLPEYDQRLAPRIYDADSNSIVDLKGKSQAEFNDIKLRYQTEGYRIVEVYHHTSNPLKETLEKAKGYNQGRVLEPVQFVVSKNMRTKPISVKQLDYRDGVHVRYLDDNFVKVPIIVGNRYYGDTTIMSARWDKDGRETVKFLNEARILYKAERDGRVPKGSLDRLFENRVGPSAPIDIGDFKAMYYGPNALDIKQPFTLLKSGTRYKDSPEFKNLNVIDMTSRYSLGDSIQLQYLGERGDGVPSVKSVDGSVRAGPILERADDNLMDAGQIIQQSLSSVIDTGFFNDYRIKAINEWIVNFSDVFTETVDQMRKAPLYYLNNPPWNEAADPELLSRAKWHRDSTLMLSAEKTGAQKTLEHGKSKILNSIRDKFGKDYADWFDDNGIFKYRDPVRALKSLAFHSKIGLFNPVHFWLNLTTLTHLTAVAPKGAAQAFRVGFLMHPTLHNRSQKMYDKMMRMSGMNPNHFRELYDGLLESGWAHMHSKGHNYVEEFGPWRTATSSVGRLLDKGTFFFREGERLVRKYAYTTAYMEWRSANLGATFDNVAKQFVTNRTNTLTVDMTNASSNRSQQGLVSVPLQFMSYQMRLSEEILSGLFTNNKAGVGLTRAEALRSMAAYSMLYGLPIGLGIPMAVVPLYDMVNKSLISEGIDPEQTIYGSLMMNGMAQTFTSAITGSNLNVAERYGPGSLTQISDAVNGETTLLEVLMGPGGSVAMDFIKSAKPGLAYLMATFNNDQLEESEKIKVTGSDLMDFARNISTVNNSLKAYYALQLGKYISKNEIPMADGLDWNDAIGIGIFGLTPTEATRAYSMREILGSQRDASIEAARQVDKEIQRMLRTDDLAERAALRRRAYLWLELSGVDPLERRAIMQRSLSRYMSESDRIEQRMNEVRSRKESMENNK